MKQEGNKKKGKNSGSQSKKTDKVREDGIGGRRCNYNYQATRRTTDSTGTADNTNRPRNWLLRDATSSVAFQFDTTSSFGVTGKSSLATRCEIRVQQSADDETWPGGALWDSGVILAQLLAALPAAAAAAASSKSTGAKNAAPLSVVTITATYEGISGAPTPAAASSSSVHRHSITVPSRLVESDAIRERLNIASSLSRQGRTSLSRRPPSTVLELGCGVGLTGMVASVSLQATVTLLTDLAVVVDKVTQPNLHRNMKVLRQHNKGGVVRAVPLCWGCQSDEANVREMLRQLDPDDASSGEVETTSATVDSSHRAPKVGGPAPPSAGKSQQRAPHQWKRQRRIPGVPDWILVGDVAYQHRPGAPSHFDALLSTLLSFTDASSLHNVDGGDEQDGSWSPIVVFATRVRMPASVDLLEMLLQHFDEVVDDPPIQADEVNIEAFRNLKHNMTIHFLRRKPRTTKGEDEDTGKLRQGEQR